VLCRYVESVLPTGISCKNSVITYGTALRRPFEISFKTCMNCLEVLLNAEDYVYANKLRKIIIGFFMHLTHVFKSDYRYRYVFSIKQFSNFSANNLETFL
jgi:hypothetical protein